MKNIWLSGVMAAGLALLAVAMLSSAPVLRTAAAAAKVHTEYAEPVPEQEPERRIQSFVVHQAAQHRHDEGIPLTVRIDGADRQMTLSEYLCGVLLGEMPADFPTEALKAQAVAARTYTMHTLESGGALSDDPSTCQAYRDPSEAPERLEKIRQAVLETDGEVLTYDGTLITATYFSCSGGRTESAQAVWGSSVPYLLSVESPGEDTEKASSCVTMDREDFMNRLGIEDSEIGETTYTEGGGVDTMVIGGETFSGTELRRKLDLRSTDFSLEVSGDTVTADVRGFGHRVGLSQYGAKAMAESGSDYREILAWYYTGAELTEAV